MIRYTALGDSITAGENASSLNLAYPSLIVSNLRSVSQPAIGQVLAYPGWTSFDLTEVVWENTPLLQQSTVISIWIGGDDLADAGLEILKGANPTEILTKTLFQYKKDIEAIIKHIQKINKGTIILCTQYNPFPNSALAIQAIQSLNQITIQTSKKYHTHLAPVNTWFQGRQHRLIFGYQTGQLEDLLSGRVPIHPNNLGHRVIADGLLPYVK